MIISKQKIMYLRENKNKININPNEIYSLKQILEKFQDFDIKVLF